MAEIDASIIGRLQPPQFDPLATVGKAQGLATGMLQNRLLGQQIGGKEALGRAVTGATDTATGETDWNKAQGILAQDPKGAFAVPEFAGTVLDKQIKELERQRASLGLSVEQGKVLSGGMLPFIQKFKTPDPKTGQPPVPTKDDFKGAVIDVITALGPNADSNVITRAAKLVQSATDDPQQLLQMATNLALLGEPTTERIQAIFGAPSTVDTGPTIKQVQVSPLSGSVRENAEVKKGLPPQILDTGPNLVGVTGAPGGGIEVEGAVTKGRTPSERATLVSVYDPVTRTTKLVPSGTLIGDQAPGGTTGPVAQSGPALGEAEGASGAAAGAVKQAADLRMAADKVPANKASLQNIRDQLSKFTPGPKANWTYLLGALSQQLGTAPPKVTEGVAAQEEFNKLATQWINSQMGALGGSGTDSKLESARHGSPNEFMSKEGIVGVTNLMLGLEDAVAAKNGAWQKWLDAGNGPESYGKFQTQFNSIYNPRVFQSAYMSQGQKTTMLKNMTPAERKQFEKDWTLAKKAGWIQ